MDAFVRKHSYIVNDTRCSDQGGNLLPELCLLKNSCISCSEIKGCVIIQGIIRLAP